MTRQRVHIGVIGTGVGCRHIEAFREVRDVEVAAVCSADQMRAGGGMPVPDFDDGMAAQVVLDACAEAARTRHWVTLASEG